MNDPKPETSYEVYKNLDKKLWKFDAKKGTR